MIVAIASCGGSSPGDMSAGDDAAPAQHDAPPVADDAPTNDWLVEYQRRIVGSLSGEREIAPGVTVAHRASVAERNATRQFLLDELTALGYTPTQQSYTSGNNPGANVVARLDVTSGTGGTIIVGGHFDSVAAGPGAADNATGVAIVLAAARYLKDVPGRQHPVVFVLFDQEELGLVGSKAYVPTLASTNVAGVHIFDMLSFDGDGDHAVELWSPAPALATAYSQAGAVAGMPVSSVTFASSDHQSFINAGLVATGVGEEFVGGDHTPNYHKATDTFENVSFDYLSRVTHLAWAVLESQVRAP
jgi:Zn-dependent M28 family amino/carboxypeptidase